MPTSASVLLSRLSLRGRFRHLQVLVTLAELGSMRRTAEALNTTQPAISQLVTEIETLLETGLFLRHARGVAPSEAMRELLPVAQRILAALGDGAERIVSHQRDRGGVVRVCASPAAIGGLLIGRIDAFMRENPGIQVHVSQSRDIAPIAAAIDGSADLICTRRPATGPEGWSFVECLEDRLAVVCGRRHPLAAAGPLEAAALGGAVWLMHRVGSVARDRFDEAADRHNWPDLARGQLIMHVPELTREMLLTGRYLALLPRSVALPWLRSGDICELDTELSLALPPLGYLWRETSSGPATRALARALAR